MDTSSPAPAAYRGRIVMLVQNGVEGDSRVQKQAETAAAAGWEVFLLGRSPSGEPRKWTIGAAKVRLLPVERVLERRAHEIRPGRLRDPLAYPYGPAQEYRAKRLKVRRLELRLAHARLAAEADRLPALSVRFRKAVLKLRSIGLRLSGAWIGLRSRHTDRLREHRSTMNTGIDRLTARLWRLLPPERVWRRFDPALWELELAFGPLIDKLGPDLIHANDFQMLGVGARAKIRARGKGRNLKLVWDVHEYLPGMAPWNPHPRWHEAQLAHEREYAPYADAVVTVSTPLADLLRERHGLAATPTVVTNAPDVRGAEAERDVPSLRERCEIGPHTPLIVYSGVAAERRGLDEIVTALPALPGVHAALVIRSRKIPYAIHLLELAERLGVADRVHFLPYVPHQQVAPFLSEADAGVIPLHHHLNHEIALITKFFEYSRARLPIVVSDVKAMAEQVTATGQGEVFKAGDAEALAQAVKAVLADPARYRAAYEDPELLAEWTWEAQARKLDAIYQRLLDG